jgi:hypothetical protein
MQLWMKGLNSLVCFIFGTNLDKSSSAETLALDIDGANHVPLVMVIAIRYDGPARKYLSLQR